MRKIPFLAVITMLLSSQLKAQAPIYHFYEYERGLVAHYPLFGNVDDYSGYQNHGVYGPNVTYSATVDGFEDAFNPNDAGLPNSCMYVQPVSGTDYFFQIPNKSQLSLNNNMAISLRFTSESYSAIGTKTVLVSKGTQFEIGYTVTSLNSIKLYYKIGTTIIEPINEQPVTAGNWYFILANLKSSAETVNQSATNSQLFSSSYTTNSTNTLPQGMSLFFYGNFVDMHANLIPIASSPIAIPIAVTADQVKVASLNFKGKFDALRIYNRALFPSEINSLISSERFEPSTIKKPLPPLAYTTNVYSSWQTNQNGTYNGNINRTAIFAQSFKATTPYITSISLNTATCNTLGKVRFEVYTFNTESTPILTDIKSPLSKPVFSGIGTINNLVATCNTWDYMPYLKVGTKYIVKIFLSKEYGTINSCTSDQKVHLFLSTRDIYGEGKAYEYNGTNFLPSLANSKTTDINMIISGGYLSKDTKDLPVMDAWSGSSNSFNRTAMSFGQTFMASTPFIKRIQYNCGSTTGKAAINIYEYSINGSSPKGNKISEECVINLSPYGTVWFDWEGTNKAMPFLQVGREYYIEITNADGASPIHYYANTGDIFSYKGSFGSTSTSGTSFTAGVSDITTDLNMTIIGMDPKLTEENAFSEWANPSSFNITGAVFKQTFIATSNYISEIVINSCNTFTDVQVSIQELTEGLTGTKVLGTVNGTYTGIEPASIANGNGCTYYFRFKYPVKVEIGKKYYFRINRSGGGTINLHGIGTDFTTYGTRLYVDGNEFLYATHPASLNIKMKGIKTGSQYTGPTEMVNNSDAGYSDNLGLMVGTFRDELKFSWERIDLQVDANFVSFETGTSEVWNFDNKIEEKAKKGGGALVIISSLNFSNFNNSNWDHTNFSNKLTAFANRYKGKPIIYEIFNEPNQRISTENQIYLIKAFSNAIRTGDLSALVCSGAFSTVGANWDDDVYQQSTDIINDGIGINGGIGTNYTDFFSYHPYWQDLPENGTKKWNYTRRLDFVRNSYNFSGTIQAPAIRNIPAFISSEFGVTTKGIVNHKSNSSIKISFVSTAVIPGATFTVLQDFGPLLPSGGWSYKKDIIGVKVPVFGVWVSTNADRLELINASTGTTVPNSVTLITNFPAGITSGTYFTFLYSSPIELDYGATYQVKLMRGSLDVSNEASANQTMYLTKAYLWHEASCNNFDKSPVYRQRASLYQLKEGVQSFVNYKLSWKDHDPVYNTDFHFNFTDNPFETTSGFAGADGFSLTPQMPVYTMKRYNDLMKFAVNIPHFSINIQGDYTQVQDIVYVAKVDPVRDELIIAIWRAKSADYNYPMTTSVVLASDEFSGEAVAYSELAPYPYNRATPITCQLAITRDVTSQPGKLIFNNIQISQKPIYLRIKRKGKFFVINPTPADVINYIEEDCNISNCKF